jgi:hypothetical protein
MEGLRVTKGEKGQGWTDGKGLEGKEGLRVGRRDKGW